MKLKKRFDQDSLKSGAPVVTHVEVLISGDHWNPSTRIMERGQAEGWLNRDGDVLTLKTAEDAKLVKYRIMIAPGLYCCHCGEKCSDSLSAAGHVKTQHKGKESPSKSHPTGYARHNFYMTDRIEE